MKTTRIIEDLKCLGAADFCFDDTGDDTGALLVKLATLASQYGLNCYQALALNMKCMVERGVALPEVGTWPVDGFHNAINQVYPTNWTAATVWVLVTEMSLMQLHTVAIASEELSFYSDTKLEMGRQRLEASPEVERALDMQRRRWLCLHTDFDQLLMARECALVKREAERQAFLRVFGSAYLAERAAHDHLQIAQACLTALEDDPTISRADLEVLRASIAEACETAAAVNVRAFDTPQFPGAGATHLLSEADLQRLRRSLKKLYMTLHPDRLRDVPLTQDQAEELRSLWDACQGIDLDHARAGNLTRPHEEIEMILERARAVLAHAGVDIDPGLIIQGESLAEQLAWLETASTTLETQVDQLHNELRIWRADLELQTMNAMLRMPEGERDDERALMLERAAEHTLEAERLEQELDRRCPSAKA